MSFLQTMARTIIVSRLDMYSVLKHSNKHLHIAVARTYENGVVVSTSRTFLTSHIVAAFP